MAEEPPETLVVSPGLKEVSIKGDSKLPLTMRFAALPLMAAKTVALEMALP